MISCAALPISIADAVDGILSRSTLKALDNLDLLRDENNRWYMATSTEEQKEHATDLGRKKSFALGEGSMFDDINLDEAAFEVLVQHSPEEQQIGLACVLVQVMQVSKLLSLSTRVGSFPSAGSTQRRLTY
jgi:hypothetical protein